MAAPHKQTNQGEQQVGPINAMMRNNRKYWAQKGSKALHTKNRSRKPKQDIIKQYINNQIIAAGHPLDGIYMDKYKCGEEFKRPNN